MKRPLICFVGPSQSGKDTAGKHLASSGRFQWGGSFSDFVAPVVARVVGCTPEEASDRRHDLRGIFADVCDGMRESDPAIFFRIASSRGSVFGGARKRIEVEAARKEKLVDLVVWIDRDVPADLTLDFGPDLADYIISNQGSIEGFHQRLDRFTNLIKVTSEACWPF